MHILVVVRKFDYRQPRSLEVVSTSTHRIALFQLLPDLLVTNKMPLDVIESKHSWQISDVHRLESLCRQVILNNEKAVSSSHHARWGRSDPVWI